MFFSKFLSLYFLSRISIYLSGIFLLIITFLNGKIDVLLLTTFFLIISIFLLELILLLINLTLTALFFTILFCIGFYLKLGLIFYDPNIFGYDNFTTLGNFSFEFNKLLNLYIVTIISTLGIFCGIYLALLGSARKQLNFQIFEYFKKKKIRKKYIISLILLWFIFSLGLLSLMNFLKIGVHGLQNQTELPNFFAGFLHFLRGFYLFSIAFCIYDILIKNCSKSLKIFFFIIFLSVVIINATMFSLNRSAALFSIIPFLILLMYESKNNFFKFHPKINFKFFICFVLFIIFLSLVGEFLNQKRSLLYTKQIVDQNFDNLFYRFIQFIVVRVEGARELMLVIDYPNKGIEVYTDVMRGMFSPADELYNFSLESNETALGLTVGFQGQSFINGSYLLSFIHSLIFFFILTKIEIFLKLRGLFTLSAHISVLLISLVWMNLDLYTIIRILFMLMLIYLTSLFFHKMFIINNLNK
jgi:hypothetical protein